MKNIYIFGISMSLISIIILDRKIYYHTLMKIIIKNPKRKKFEKWLQPLSLINW